MKRNIKLINVRKISILSYLQKKEEGKSKKKKRVCKNRSYVQKVCKKVIAKIEYSE